MIHTRRPASSGSQRTPYSHLAVRVIDQAFRDLTSPVGLPADQESARVFLAGSSMFYHWCEVADLDPTWMVARARKLMARVGRFSVPAVIEAVIPREAPLLVPRVRADHGRSDRSTSASSFNA